MRAAQAHAVQIYENESFLYETVGQYIAAGLSAGERVVVIAAEEHVAGFLACLEGHDIAAALEVGRLTLLDARASLAEFMDGEVPDRDRFRAFFAKTLEGIRRGDDKARVRAYGEMVDVLWREGNSRAAIRLEELWNEVREEESFSLLCAYLMGNFLNDTDGSRFLAVCRNHTHVAPTERFSELNDRAAELREMSILEARAASLGREVEERKELERALREALKARSRVEEELRASVAREHEARAKAEASEKFKEVFLGILGHDLRNPLNTVLMTTRLMAMRHEVPPESEKRLERVIASGLRMQRMIDHLLDLARGRILDGIPVDLSTKSNVSEVVERMVDEVRAAHPERTIELRAAPCEVRHDKDRLEQVVSSLLGNAIAHGDPKQPIVVDVTAEGAGARVSVHNEGPPIDPTLLPQLFDPFQRATRPPRFRRGLGLGLYIAQKIMEAHGGTLRCESEDGKGTTFIADLPGS
jgi:signal transduction histidine kinase